MKCKICMKERCSCKYESSLRLNHSSHAEIHQKHSFDSRKDLLDAARERKSSSKLPVDERQPQFLPFDEYIKRKNDMSETFQPPAEATSMNQQVRAFRMLCGSRCFLCDVLMLHFDSKLRAKKHSKKISSFSLVKNSISVEFLTPSKSVVKREFWEYFFTARVAGTFEAGFYCIICA